MPGYWWECEACGGTVDFPEATGTSSFVWDRLLASEWDQSLLTPPCKKCANGVLRITYEFPRGDKVVLRVIHIVGLHHDDYVPMMWKTYPKDSPADRRFDFKYQRVRSPWGLNKAALLSRQDLHALFERYREKTGVHDFP
jgi:hypothetical protein